MCMDSMLPPHVLICCCRGQQQMVVTRYGGSGDRGQQGPGPRDCQATCAARRDHRLDFQGCTERRRRCAQAGRGGPPRGLPPAGGGRPRVRAATGWLAQAALRRRGHPDQQRCCPGRGGHLRPPHSARRVQHQLLRREECDIGSSASAQAVPGWCAHHQRQRETRAAADPGPVTFVVQRVTKEAARQTLADVLELSDDRAIDDLVRDYYADVEAERQGDWIPPYAASYSLSKACLNAYTRVLAKCLSDERPPGRKLYVNAFCPGPTATDMRAEYWRHLEGTPRPYVTADEAARYALQLTLLPACEMPSGILFSEGREIDF